MNTSLNCSTKVYADHPGFTVHQHESGPTTFFTNGFVVETTNSLVIIDTMMTISEARSLRRYAESLVKPIAAILITHGHPDHYNGIGEFQDKDMPIPVVTTRGVDETIRNCIDSKELKWRPVFGAEWPSVKFSATRHVSSGERLVIDDVPFEVLELGTGESNADSCWLVGESERAIRGGPAQLDRNLVFLSEFSAG
jgi:glyoxylase-like metal-dependent hydrolase (beta-lactamase superfamily II)